MEPEPNENIMSNAASSQELKSAHKEMAYRACSVRTLSIGCGDALFNYTAYIVYVIF